MELVRSLSQQWELAPSTIVLGFYTALSAIVYGSLGIFIWLKPLDVAKKPYLTWAVLLPLVFIPLWIHPWAWIAAITLLSIYGFKEFAKGTGLYAHWPYIVVVYTLMIGMALAAVAKNYGLFMALPIWGVALVTALPVMTNTADEAIQRVALSVIGLVYFGWFLAHLGYLRQADGGIGYVVYVVLATQFNDALAFLWGKLVGKTTWTALSPKKTIEGSVLALLSSIGLAYLNWPIAFPHFEWWLVGLVGIIVGVGGQIGDLVMSAFKRDLGIKDFGDMLPGHGGILDRIDSLLWVVPVFFHTVRFFHGGFG
ncbi:MAG: phosphatidate cytidylyltransferase, partial [Cyanobacteria bacterium]|nr:phosphatidate cytidylyltransferase [Cyanobacteriota bacterium]MDW8203001.1 phosphatidate cytidylyltransferase [Cyanobacteriota bacterium SKYGB_h_bin112]